MGAKYTRLYRVKPFSHLTIPLLKWCVFKMMSIVAIASAMNHSSPLRLDRRHQTALNRHPSCARRPSRGHLECCSRVQEHRHAHEHMVTESIRDSNEWLAQETVLDTQRTACSFPYLALDVSSGWGLSSRQRRMKSHVLLLFSSSLLHVLGPCTWSSTKMRYEGDRRHFSLQ